MNTKTFDTMQWASVQMAELEIERLQAQGEPVVAISEEVASMNRAQRRQWWKDQHRAAKKGSR